MKKMLSLLMALMMLVMPTLGLADADAMVVEAVEAGRRAETTLTLSLDGLPVDEATGELISDITDALNLTIFTQQGGNAENGFVLNMSDRSILNGAFAVRGDTLYLDSNLLGEQAVAVSAEDIMPLTGRFIDLMVLMEAMNENDAEMLKSMLEEVVAMGATEMTSAAMDIDWSSTDFDGFMIVLEELLNNAQVETVTMQPRNCDPATEKGRIVITGDDILALWQAVETMMETTPDLTMMLDSALASSGATAAMLMDEVSMMIQQIAAYLPNGLILDLYVNDDGELVSMTLLAEIMEPGAATVSGNVVVGMIGEAAAPAQQGTVSGTGEVLGALGGQYTRLTMNDGVAHTFNVEMEDHGELLSVSVDVLAKDNGFVCNIGMAENGENIMNLAISADSVETAAAVQDAASYQLEINDGYESVTLGVFYDAKSEQIGLDVQQNKTVTLAVDGVALLTVNAATQTMDPVATIDTANALRLATITEEEFQGWFVDVINGLQYWLVEVLQALPASVLQLMLGE